MTLSRIAVFPCGFPPGQLFPLWKAYHLHVPRGTCHTMEMPHSVGNCTVWFGNATFMQCHSESLQEFVDSMTSNMSCRSSECIYLQIGGNIFAIFCHDSFELWVVTIFYRDSGQWRCRNPIHRWVQSLVVFGHRQLKLLGSMLATFKGHRAPAVCFTSFHCMFHWFHLVSIHPWYDNKLDRRYVVLKAGMELKVEAVRLPNPCNNLWFLVVFVERYASESQPGTTKSQYLPRERASTTRPLNLAEVVDVSVACSCKAWTIWMVERHMRCGGSGYHCQGRWSEVVWMIYDKQDA